MRHHPDGCSNGTEKIYKLQVIRGADENHAAFGFIDVSLEMHAQNEREAARKLIDGIISEYNLAYSVNLENDTFERRIKIKMECLF